MSVVIRDYRESDAPIVFKSWMKSYSLGKRRLWREIPRWRIHKFHRPFVDEIAARSRIIVCALPAPTDAAPERDEVLGFLAYETPILHYLYTKIDYRRRGVARALFDRAEEDGPLLAASHDTHLWRKFVDGLGRDVEYSPGEAFYPPGDKRADRREG